MLTAFTALFVAAIVIPPAIAGILALALAATPSTRQKAAAAAAAPSHIEPRVAA